MPDFCLFQSQMRPLAATGQRILFSARLKLCALWLVVFFRRSVLLSPRTKFIFRFIVIVVATTIFVKLYFYTVPSNLIWPWFFQSEYSWTLSDHVLTVLAIVCTIASKAYTTDNIETGKIIVCRFKWVGNSNSNFNLRCIRISTEVNHHICSV